MLIPFTVTSDSLQHHTLADHKRVLRQWKSKGILLDGVNNRGNSIVDGEVDRLGFNEKNLWQKNLAQARKNGPRYKKLEHIDTNHFFKELKSIMVAPPDGAPKIGDTILKPVKEGIKVFIVPDIPNKKEQGYVKLVFSNNTEIQLAMLNYVELESPATITFMNEQSIDHDVWKATLKTTISQYKTFRIIDRYILENWKGYLNLLTRISRERPETKMEISLVSRPRSSNGRMDWPRTNATIRDIRSDLSKLAALTTASFSLHIVKPYFFRAHARDMLLGRGYSSYRITSDNGFGFFEYENIQPETPERLIFEGSIEEISRTEAIFNNLIGRATETIKV